MRKNSSARSARERAERLAQRRRVEEEQFVRIGKAVSRITRSVGHLNLAVEMANDELQGAFDEIAAAIDVLGKLGYRVRDIAQVVGVDPRDLRPGLTLALRRTRGRSQPGGAASSPVPTQNEGPADIEAGSAPRAGAAIDGHETEGES